MSPRWRRIVIVDLAVESGGNVEGSRPVRS